MLGLVYIFATAKPISMRRLSVLFVLTLVTVRCFYGIVHVDGGRTVSLITAGALTILAWASPVLRAVRHSVKARRLVLDALGSASGLVHLSYGSVLATVTLLAFQIIANPLHPVTLGMLLQVCSIASLAETALF